MKIRRMHTSAWRLAQELAQGQAGFRPARAREMAELRRVRLVSADAHLDERWQHILSGMTTAPVALRIVAAQDDACFGTDVVLYESIGLAVTERGTTRVRHDGSREVATAEGAVDVVLFRHDELWPVVRRVLPPIDEMRAGPDRGAPVQTLPVTPEDQARVRAMMRQDPSRALPLDAALRLMRDPDPRFRDMLAATTSVAMLGLARSTPRHVSFRQWQRGARGLYLTAADGEEGVRAFQVGAGHLAADLSRTVAELLDRAGVGERVTA